MDAVKCSVEYALGFDRTRAEQRGKEVAQRTVCPLLDFLGGPWWQPESAEGIAVAFDDCRPSIDQRVVPVEQNGARRLRSSRLVQATASPVSANRTYSSRRRRAV